MRQLIRVLVEDRESLTDRAKGAAALGEFCVIKKQADFGLYGCDQFAFTIFPLLIRLRGLDGFKDLDQVADHGALPIQVEFNGASVAIIALSGNLFARTIGRAAPDPPHGRALCTHPGSGAALCDRKNPAG